MAQQYDRTMKRLTSVFTGDYVRFVLGTEVFRAEAVEIEEKDKELPSLSREVDFVCRVELDGESALLLIEFQTAWAADMPQRMAGYSWRLHERYGEGVYPVVVVLRPGGQLQGEWRMSAWGRDVAWCRTEVRALWEVEAEEVVSQGLVGLYPLLPLMRWQASEPAVVLARSQDLILEQIEGREARADAYVALRVLSGMSYPMALVDQILQRRELMLESPVYEQIMEEGRQAGREQGREQGREEGLQAGLREGVLEVLEVRFGAVPSALAEQVRQLKDRERLEGLHRRAIVVESLEVFAGELTGA